MKRIYILLMAFTCLSLTINAQDLRVELLNHTPNQVIMGPVGADGFATIPVSPDLRIINDGPTLISTDTIVLGLLLNNNLFSLALTQGGFNFIDTTLASGDTLTFNVGGLFLGFPQGAAQGTQSVLCAYASLVGADSFNPADTTFNGDLTPGNNIACVTYELDGTVVGIEENLEKISGKTYIANNQLIIENNDVDFNTPAIINVINIAGQVIHSENMVIQRGRNTIGLNNLNTGIYIVSIQVEGQLTTKKVFVR